MTEEEADCAVACYAMTHICSPVLISELRRLVVNGPCKLLLSNWNEDPQCNHGCSEHHDECIIERSPAHYLAGTSVDSIDNAIMDIWNARKC